MSLRSKVWESGLSEIRGWLDRRRRKKAFVDKNLDPVLKSADELTGRLLTFAKDDFRSIRYTTSSLEQLDNDDFNSLLYYLVRFWACLEIFQQESLSISLGSDKRSDQFQSFVNCLYSRQNRIVSRIAQRAAAELMIYDQVEHGVLSTMSYIKFIELIERDKRAQRWISPVVTFLNRTNHTSVRQRIFKYGIVVHAMVDILDPYHRITSDRPSYPTRLSRRTWRDLKYRIFDVYLGFVPNSRRKKYLGTRP